MKTKTFDCIKMKEECQQAVQRKYGGLRVEERRKKMVADILAHPVLGEIYRQTFRRDGLDPTYRPATFVAESPAEYEVPEDSAE